MVRIHHFSREKYDDIFLILGQVKFKGYCLKGTSPHPPHKKNIPVCGCEFWPYFENSLTCNNILLVKKSIFLANKSGFLAFKNEFFIFFFMKIRKVPCVYF